MQCPVCDNKNISPFATHCLNCNADVLAYPLLEDLEDQCVVALKEKISLEGALSTVTQLRKNDKKAFKKTTNRFYWVFFLLPLLLLWYIKNPISDKTQINDLITENNDLNHKITSLEIQVDSLSQAKTTPYIESYEVVHVVSRGDNLYKLAEKYLGDGKEWRTLIKLNPNINNPNYLRKNDTISIKLK